MSCGSMTWLTWFEALKGIMEFTETYEHVNTGFLVYRAKSKDILGFGSIG